MVGLSQMQINYTQDKSSAPSQIICHWQSDGFSPKPFFDLFHCHYKQHTTNGILLLRQCKKRVILLSAKGRVGNALTLLSAKGRVGSSGECKSLERKKIVVNSWFSIIKLMKYDFSFIQLGNGNTKYNNLLKVILLFWFHKGHSYQQDGWHKQYWLPITQSCKTWVCTGIPKLATRTLAFINIGRIKATFNKHCRGYGISPFSLGH